MYYISNHGSTCVKVMIAHTKENIYVYIYEGRLIIKFPLIITF